MAVAPPVSLMVIADESVPEFVSLDEKHACVVCGQALRSPVQTTCGHRMCRVCLEGLFADVAEGADVPCPGGEEGCDRLTLAEVYPDFCAEKELKQKTVYCKNRKYGCPAQLQWRKLKHHMDSCAYCGRQCPYRDFGCPVVVASSHYNQHVQHDCEYIPVECQYCKINVPKTFMGKHQHEECRNVPVNCPYECGKLDTRQKIEEHIVSCPRRPQECQFKESGCDFRGSRAELERHLQEAAVNHVTLLSASKDSHMLQIKALEKQLQDTHAERNTLEVLCKEYKGELEKVSKKLEANEKRIRDLQKNAASQAMTLAKMEEASSTFAKEEQLKCFEIEIIHLKDKLRNLEEQMRTNQSGGASGGAITGELRQKVMTYERQLGIHDVRLAEIGLRFTCLENASYNGVLVWKIDEYRRRKAEAASGKTLSLYSQPFHTARHGYKMCARAYLNGDGMGKNGYMSLFFVVMRGEFDSLLPWPFPCKVTLSLLDQQGGGRHCSDTFRPDPSSSSFRKPVTEMNVASGCPCFVAHSTLERPPFLVNDTLFIKVAVDARDVPVF